MVDRTKFPVELLTEIGREGAELLLKDNGSRYHQALFASFSAATAIWCD